MVLQCCEPGVSLDALVIVIRLITQQLWDGVIRKTMGVYFWMKKFQQTCVIIESSAHLTSFTMYVVHQMLYLVIALGMAVPLHLTPWICAFAGIGILTLSTYNEQLAAKVIDCTYLLLPTIQVLTTATLLSVMVRNDQEKLFHSFSIQN
ncbi:putative potassium transporter 15 [Frankliniella fusca]|uniref:Potassium transporter 15 n=1 Tax=Frankliniella fusca TaxID=407009 RepID=A0AAE1HBP1_9NEOP|nr:putative potassium transporter 15 [Frankliniella fusca]